jgi:hypothetical protein
LIGSGQRRFRFFPNFIFRVWGTFKNKPFGVRDHAMIGFEITKMFFDKKAVRDKVDRGTRRVLSRFGAFVRRGARSSIRKRKKVSAPGAPPSSHIGLLKKFIYFGYEPSNRSVVIGPVRLSQNGRGEAPELLEHGGTTTLQRRGKRVRANIRKRPFMGPAFAKEQPKLPAMWRDSIPRN